MDLFSPCIHLHGGDDDLHSSTVKVCRTFMVKFRTDMLEQITIL